MKTDMNNIDQTDMIIQENEVNLSQNDACENN